MDQVVSGI